MSPVSIPEKNHAIGSRFALIVVVLLIAVTACVGATVGLRRARDSSPKIEKKASDSNVLLETIGTLTASNLYQTYLNIGFLADGVAEGALEEKEALELLASVQLRLELTSKQLARLAKLDLSREDQQTLEQLHKVNDLLADQARGLQAYWTTGDQEHGDKYDKVRKEAWESLHNLL